VQRAPGSVSEFTDEKLAVMKALLEPVMIGQKYWFYMGWPLRIIQDPGTAFRRAIDGTEPPEYDGEQPGTIGNRPWPPII
jgi:hypothetical protein